MKTFEFDYKWFSRTLQTELQLGFKSLLEAHKNETPYCFGLIAESKFYKLSPILLTEEMLWRAIDEFRKEQPHLFVGVSRQNTEWYMRYAYTIIAHDYFLSDYLPETIKILNSYEDKTKLSIGDEIKYRQTCLEVLKEIDKTGLFGVSIERDKVTLLFNLIDVEDIRVEDINYLNPQKVFDRYRITMSKGEGIRQIIQKNLLKGA